MLREDPWELRQNLRFSIVMSALATELLAWKICQEFKLDVTEKTPLGGLLKKLKSKLPSSVHQGAMKTNNARILAVHPKGEEPTEQHAINALLGATRFYIWNYHRREQ